MAQVDVYKLNAQLKTVVVGVRLALTSIKLALTSTYAWSLAWLFSIGVMSVTSALVAPRHGNEREPPGILQGVHEGKLDAPSS